MYDKNGQRYDYTSAGFGSFLTRSIDGTGVSASSGGTTSSRAIAFDRQQIGGVLGDTLKIGNIQLDGVNGRISVVDDNNDEVVRLGNLEG